MSTFYIPTNGPEDWQKLLAEPALNRSEPLNSVYIKSTCIFRLSLRALVSFMGPNEAHYKLPAPRKSATVAFKVIDMLGEETVVTNKV